MEAKLQQVKQTLRARMHEPVPQVGEWLRTCAERLTTNTTRCRATGRACAGSGSGSAAIGGTSLERRSQRGRLSWTRLARFFDRWLPIAPDGASLPERAL